jgi:hypothetical protein
MIPVEKTTASQLIFLTRHRRKEGGQNLLLKLAVTLVQVDAVHSEEAFPKVSTTHSSINEFFC